MKPTRDNVILQEIARGKTKGGVELPDGVTYGKEGFMVISVGPGFVLPNGDLIKCSVEPGDFVIICAQAGPEFTWEGTKYLITADANIRAIVKKADIKKFDILGGI